MQPPSQPQLPPMKPAATVPSASMPSAPGGVGGLRRMRQIVTAIAGGGFMLVIVILFFQLVARPGLRPTDLMATIEAQTELGIMNQKLGGKAGEMVLTEADYQAKLAEAQRSGAAKAELAFQTKLAAVQADKERVVAAYSTLYQRANNIAQSALQLEAMAQSFRQQLLAMTNGGRSVVISVEDGLCALGSEEACQAARDARKGMIAESDELSRGDVGARVRELMAGIDDPATFTVHEDEKRNGVPAIDRR